MDFKKQIDEKGYIVLPSLISKEQCEKLKNKLDTNYLDFRDKYASNSNGASHGLDDKSKEKVVYNLHNKDYEWYELFEHPEVNEILEYMLMSGSYQDAEPYYLYNNSARCPLKDNPGQQLHLDSRLPGINHCIVANVLWALDDFTEQNGATRVVPGSHKFMEFTENGKIYDEEILLTAPQGSAIIFNANLWHGGGPNYDGSSRWALALGYARWFIKPVYDYLQNIPEDIYSKLTVEQQKLIGLQLCPPKDEFTRVRRIAPAPEKPLPYQLPTN